MFVASLLKYAPMTDPSGFEYRQMSFLLPRPMNYLKFKSSAGLNYTQVSSLTSLLSGCHFLLQQSANKNPTKQSFSPQKKRRRMNS